MRVGKVSCCCFGTSLLCDVAGFLKGETKGKSALVTYHKCKSQCPLGLLKCNVSEVQHALYSISLYSISSVKTAVKIKSLKYLSWNNTKHRPLDFRVPLLLVSAIHTSCYPFKLVQHHPGQNENHDFPSDPHSLL